VIAVPDYTETHYDVNEIETAVFTAGDGDPLVFLHGGGTFTGFEALLPLAERFRLILPHHPGYGASADDPSVSDIHDYVRHYLDLFDQIGLDEFAAVGHSLGGYMASTMAMYVGRRISSLVLAAPFGLRAEVHPTLDIFSIPDEEILGVLTNDMSVYEGKFTMPPSPEWLADRYREATSLARLLWERPYDLKLAKWLHRIAAPTLVLWGDADALIPVEQAAMWAELIPGATTQIFPGVGHLMFDESPDAVAALGAFVTASASASAR
jgi:pimeloyl-ACP methyl ester carboxylesterase